MISIEPAPHITQYLLHPSFLNFFLPSRAIPTYDAVGANRIRSNSVVGQNYLIRSRFIRTWSAQILKLLVRISMHQATPSKHATRFDPMPMGSPNFIYDSFRRFFFTLITVFHYFIFLREATSIRLAANYHFFSNLFPIPKKISSEKDNSIK